MTRRCLRAAVVWASIAIGAAGAGDVRAGATAAGGAGAANTETVRASAGVADVRANGDASDVAPARPGESATVAAAVELSPGARARAELLLDTRRRPPGDRIRAAVALTLPEGWHVYGPDPGDTGLPTTVRWAVERGVAHPGPWPPTERFEALGGAIVSRGWTGRVLLPAALELQADAPPDAWVRAAVSFLACADECVPATLDLSRRLDGHGAVAPRTERAELERAFAAPGARGSGPAGPLPAATETAPAGAPPPATPAPPARAAGLWMTLALAFLGGLVLNLMPCVLPVLGIKAVAVAELAQRSRRDVLAHGAAYTAGILGSMALLAAAVIALRGAGRAVGWGFQFQEPLFLVGLALGLAAFALNLLGVFELGLATGGLARLGERATGARRSLVDGLLAVALATPCSAPFLGTAVGLALASPATHVLAIFLAVGLGLAAPFAALTVWPRWAAWLPRPGPWMATLRSALGFVLLFTGVWLAWILGRVAGADAVVGLLALGVGVGAGAWAVGAAQRAGRSPVRALLGPAALVVLLAPNVVAVHSPPTGAPAGDDAVSGVPVETRDAAWSPAAVEQALGEGRPVLAYFTADWCITCKVNEARVLDRPDVRGALARAGVVVLRGDWTRRDDAIRAELARHGRAGVPLVLLYDPADPEHPERLPELLGRERLLAALEGLGGHVRADASEPGHIGAAVAADVQSREGRAPPTRRTP